VKEQNVINSIETSYLEVGYIERTPVQIPITTIGGERRPRFTIVCGVHGDEMASVEIAYRVVQELVARDSLHGSISIITSANPLAGFTRSRVSSSEGIDLNRVFPGRADGYLTERIAHHLYHYLLECDFFVDVHEFKMRTPPLALYLPGSQEEVDTRILQGIVAFDPSVVWIGEAAHSQSVLAALTKDGVPGFAVETTHLAQLEPETIDKVAKGLIKVIDLVNAKEGLRNVSTSAGAFYRTITHSDHAGFWTPDAKVGLLGEIKKGDTIGTVSKTSLVEDIPVLAEDEGILMQLTEFRLVDTGTPLFSTGVRDSTITARLQDVASMFNSK
jgi:predicted deacylase